VDVEDEKSGRAERVTGIEPAFSAWEADVLPLNYTRGAPKVTKAVARPARHTFT
jgi:hypothetical protein